MPHALPNLIPMTAIMTTMLWNAMDFPAGVVMVSQGETSYRNVHVQTGSWTDADEKALEAYPEKGFVETEVKRECKVSY